MKTTPIAILLSLTLLAAGCGEDDSSKGDATAPSGGSPSAASAADAANRSKPKVTVPKGAPPKKLVERDLIEGSGATAEAGDRVTVQYVGVGYDTRKEFDASWNRNEPFSFGLGAGEVIPGWDQGIEGMKEGGQRELTIPPNLAYGPAGSPPTIGPNETLVFVVDLLAVE